MPNLIDVVVALAEVFDRLAIRFAVGGALANNYWGTVRATRDVDCLISLPQVKYQLFADELNAMGFNLRDTERRNVPLTVPKLLEQARIQKIITSYYQTVRVDFFVPVIPLQDEILRRAVPVPLGARQVPITTAEDLILLKLIFHRDKDLIDVRGILWLQRGRLDLDYLRLWSGRTHEPDVQKELDELVQEYSREDKND
jgi:predicted nucleotidyltransferase